MNALVSASARFAVTDRDQLWTENASLGYGFWARYLEVYDEIRLVARAVPAAAPPPGWIRATGPGVRGGPVPDFQSAGRLLARHRAVRAAVGALLDEVEAVHLRVPCFVGSFVWRALQDGRPYGVEVVGDPRDMFAAGSVRHPLRRLLQWGIPRELRLQCAGATGALYVTAAALQARYPCPQFSIGASDVMLPEWLLAQDPRPRRAPRDPVTVIMVGSLGQLYKAPDVLIDAVGRCVSGGLPLRLVVVGDGRHRATLEARAEALGLAGRARFVGALTSLDAVVEQLDRADLFVLPSRQEGLPRAMVEAMARGLPCIGSTVGGIPELLAPEDLVPPGDAPALARKLREVVGDPERLVRMSMRNLEKAKEYRAAVTRAGRIVFYRHVRRRTEKWQRTRRRRRPCP
ncbi:MAG: glycosyltransferase [Candidatus Rokuibacteriota bacterium]